jgi:cytochrome c oxidase subunit IV
MTASTATPEQMAHEERRYVQVFVWLAVLTALEISATFLPLSHFVIGIALVLLAASKASLVALYYMHLVHEKPTLTYIALTPAILCVFLVLMLLPDLGAITRLITTAIEHTAEATGH